MDRLSKLLAVAYSAIIVIVFISLKSPAEKRGGEEDENPLAPYEFADYKRTWPNLYPDNKAFQNAMVNAAAAALNKAGNPFDEQWRIEGPGNIGGRINCISVNPQNSNTIFTGCPTGGIYKTTDGGLNWLPVFDDQSHLSIATITIDPIDTNVMYAGTGDPNITFAAFKGNGIYKSVDGGDTWSHLGLSDQSIVSKICVDPTNTQVIYAATMGIPYQTGPNRGLYKSIDGGQNWTQVLFISNDAGIIDMVMDPSNPQTLYAAGWNRIRNNQVSIGSGNASKIFKTTDGGQNWTVLTNGLPGVGQSRISLDILPSNPQTLYTSYVDANYNLLGLYTTTDGGSNWSPISTNGIDNNALGGFGWYFGHFNVNPYNPNEMFLLGIELWKSVDGGQTWDIGTPEWWTYEVHADKHAIHFLSNDTWLLGTDGGLYKTTTDGQYWNDIDVIPNTQFYRVATNPFSPANYYGGAQDNGTTGGNINNFANWPRLFGGDGFTPVFDPTDPNVYYYEVQNGVIYYTNDDGANFDVLDAGLDQSDRFNWDMPYFLSATEPSTMYCASHRVYKMDGAPYGTWEPISPDLTDGNIFGGAFHDVSTIAQSPLNADMLYAGTSDGNVWRSINNGQTWQNVTATLPDRYVTSVRTSFNNPNTVYVTHSGYRDGDFIPHIHKSTNNGTTWVDITGDLGDMAVNDILPFEGNDSLLFAATDAGVYATVNMGVNWYRVGTNMPILIVDDVEFNASTGRLIAGTHGRSIMTYPLDKILTDLAPDMVFAMDVKIYPNPTTDVLNIRMPAAKKPTIKIFSVDGKQMPANTNGNNTFTLDVANFPAGIYYLVAEEGKYRAVKKFVKS
jgi:photosystem II stability/assembly factor-like uncharacterized protein